MVARSPSNYNLFYLTLIWLQKILTGQIWLKILKEVIEVNELDKGNICGRRFLVEDNLQWKTTFGGRHLRWKTTFGGRWPSVEDNLCWKMTFGERRPLGEENLQWKTTFGERRPSVEDDLRWKTTLGGSQPLVEDDLRRKPTFGGRGPWVEDDLLWNMTFGRRWPLVEDDLQWKMTFLESLHAAYSALRHFFKWVRILPEINWCHYQGASPTTYFCLHIFFSYKKV